MNENLNLCEILKDVPEGTELWSPACGYCTLGSVATGTFVVYSMSDCAWIFRADGMLSGAGTGAEVAIFPSKEQRDWSKFKASKQNMKVTLHPFERVLVRDYNDNKWQAGLFSHYDIERSYVCLYAGWKQCIPYNEQTAHLLDTSDPCPIDYDIELSKEYIPF